LDQAAPPDTGDTETGRFGGPKPTVENLPAAIEAAKKTGAVSLAAMMQNKLNELQAAQTTSEPVSVTKAATQVDPVDFLGAAGAATDILSGYDDAMTRAGVPVGLDDKPASRAVDADDMAGIGSVAPRSAVQEPTDGIGAVLTEGYDMAGRPATPPDVYDDDVDQGSADVGALAKELGIDVKDVDFRERGLADLLKPGGIIKDIGGLFTGKGALKEAAAGGQVVKNEKGETVGVVSYDDEGKVSKVTPVGIKESFDPALRDAYRDFYANQPEERDSDGGEPILPEDVAVEEEAAPEKPPTIDIVPFRPEDFYYFNPQSRYPYGLTSLMNMRTS
jgi:hypothetical protein